MEYKTAILKLVESVHDEKALKIIYSFLQGYLFLAFLLHQMSCTCTVSFFVPGRNQNSKKKSCYRKSYNSFSHFQTLQIFIS